MSAPRGRKPRQGQGADVVPLRGEPAADAPEVEPAGPPRGSLPVWGSRGWWFTPEGVWQASGGNCTQVLPWCPIVEERLVLRGEDGSTGRAYRLTVGEDTADVLHAELQSGEAWEHFPDAIGTGAKSTREVLVNVVGAQAETMPRVPAVDRTGWHEIGGRLVYVFADGRTFPEGYRARLVGAPERLAQAARPLPGRVSDAQVRDALAAVAAHGWAPLVGLGAGARSFGQSVLPVPAMLAVTGTPNAGKSCSVALGRALAVTRRPAPWPPLATESFSATRTALEQAVNFEADMPSLLDDLALTGDATAVEVRAAVEKLEAIGRAVGNQEKIRGRSTRKLTPAPAAYVRSIPAVTAQMLPPAMQASLYRRSVVLDLVPGEVDVDWYRDHGAELDGPLREVGARIVARLAECRDQETAAGALAEWDRAGLRRLAAALDVELPGWDKSLDGLDGVVRAAGAMLGGLVLIAEVAGLDPAELLTDALCRRVARALAGQAERMADRRAAADDLGAAVGELVLAALYARRAHVRDDQGAVRPAVPGQTEQAQGLRRLGPVDWEGAGPALHWLPDRGGLAIPAVALHSLLRGSPDPRVAGLTPRSLPTHLLRADAVVPTPARRAGEPVATQEVRTTHLSGRVLVLRPELVWGEDAAPAPRAPAHSADPNRENRENRESAGQEPVLPLDTDAPPENRESAGQGPNRASPAPATADPDNALTSALAVLTVPDFENREDRPRVVDRAELPPVPEGVFRAAFAVLDVDPADSAGGGLVAWLPEDVAVRVPVELVHAGDVAGLVPALRLGRAVEGRKAPDVGLVYVTARAAARLGLPAHVEALAELEEGHPFVTAAAEAGWQVSAGGGRDRLAWRLWVTPPGVDPAAGWHPGRAELLVPHLADAGCPLEVVDGRQLAADAALFAEQTGGVPWAGGVSVRIMRESNYTRRDRRRRAEGKRDRYYLEPPGELPAPVVNIGDAEPFFWSAVRALTAAERSRPHLHVLDVNGMYLAAASAAELGIGVPEHVDRPDWDRKRAGVWLARVRWPHRLQPDPFHAGQFGGVHLHPVTGQPEAEPPARWYSTASVDLAMREGIGVELLEAWLFPDRVRYLSRSDKGGRGWYERLRDARSTLSELRDALPAGPERDRAGRVLTAVKETYAYGLGDLASWRRHDRNDLMYRPHWAAEVRALARANLMRHLVPAGARGVFPFAVVQDAVLFATDDPDPAALGLELSGQLGKFKVQDSAELAAVLPLFADGAVPAPVELLRAIRGQGEVVRGG